MKKSGLIAVSLVFALSIIAACGGMEVGSEGTSNGASDEPGWEELVGTINDLEAKVSKQEREIESLQDILSMVSEHLVAAEGDITAHDGRLTTAEGNITSHDGRLTTAEGNITTIQSNNALLLDPYLTISSATINSLAGPHVILTGANLHVRSGAGATNAGVNGVGNLLVGYNEAPFSLDPGDRGGSHNLIVGPEHKYSNYGGFVAGITNTVSGQYSSVSGGSDNTASGWYSSVSGGAINTASGNPSSVSGGYFNEASGFASSVSAGDTNEASGQYSSVTGGDTNEASGWYSSISGGDTVSTAVDYDWKACDVTCGP